MDFRNLVNQEQLKGIESQSQYIRIIAGAGSGKTRVLTYRIAFLIGNLNVSPSNILGITFTNKAAKEIRDRISSIIPFAHGMNLCTIHSWCAKFLRSHASLIGYPTSFTIIDEDDQKQIMKNIFVNNGLPKNDPHIKECLNWICNKKTEGIQYSDIEDTNFPNPLMNQFKSYFREYTEYLRKTASLDFDDLLLKTIEILKDEQNGVRKFYQKRLAHILVDEFQDINDVQFELIRLLMDKYTNLYVVGDPDQTIYTWRGANHRIMLDFESKLQYDYKDAKVETIFLKNNYRSSKNILDCANRLIVNNKEREPKDLLAINPEGEKVSLYNARTIGEETSYIASIIKEKAGLNKDYRKFAVLYRSNFLTRELETQLNLRNIPYKIFGGQKFYQRREIKDVIAYLNLLLNPLDDTSLERIINVPKRNIGASALDVLKTGSSEAGQSIYLYILQSNDIISLQKSKKEKLMEFVDGMEQLKEDLKENASIDYGDIVGKYLDNIGYFKYIEEEDNGEDRQENVKELIGTIKEFFKVNPDAAFEEFVNNASLQSSGDEVENGNYVSLMTVHTAKGLEFEQVFLYGFNEGIFPSRRAIEESKRGIEEERRLAYVAITRARKKLYITLNQDFSYVMGTKLVSSRFLKEMGFKDKNEADKTNKYLNNYLNPYAASSYKPKNSPPPKPLSNGVSSWNVDDLLEHEQFGIGVVIKVVSDKLIEVQFRNKEYGIKTLLGSHYKIKKLTN